MDNRLVSVCIPTYNSVLFLKETLESILLQSYQNIEIIIGDNASNDGTCDVIDAFAKLDKRISFYINQTNIGYSKNCNKLISLANGDFIAIYHSDDVYEFDIIEKEVNFLNKNINFLGVFTSYEKIKENGDIITKTKYPIVSNDNIINVSLYDYLSIVLLEGGSCFCCPTSMIRKEVYFELSGYDVSLKYIEDQDMWARILLLGPLAIINEKLIKYRIHDGQGSSIYLKRELNSFSLPLNHAIDFINKNHLVDYFKTEILIAEAKEFIFLALIASRKYNFYSFHQSINHSKSKYKLNFLTKKGVVQNFPIVVITFYFLQFFYLFKSIKNKVLRLT